MGILSDLTGKDWLGLGLGAAGLYSSYSQGKAASSAMNQQSGLAEEQLAMAKAEQERHNKIYGNLEENLAKYYTSLTPGKMAKLGLSRYDKQFKQAHDNYTKSMAQRGLAGSGIDAEGEMRMNEQAAMDRTNIINQADRQTKADQLGFLGVGLGQGNIAATNAANAYRAAESSYGNQATLANQNANAAAQGVGNLAAGFMYDRGRQSVNQQPSLVQPSTNQFAGVKPWNVFKD